MCAIDCTLTGHRTDSTRTYFPKGSGQPRLAAPISVFTNLIINCLWADGEQWTLCMLFTFNRKFQLIREGKQRRKKWKLEVEHPQDQLRQSIIDPERVVYIGNGNEDSRTYVSEVDNLPSCLEGYFAHWKNIRKYLKDCVIFSDNGHGFFKGKGADRRSILKEIGFGRHICFGADVHEVLSPCDNRLHGRKSIWKAELRGDFSDDVASCLRLVDIFDKVPKDDVIGWWNTNLQLDSQKVTMERAYEAIGNRRTIWSEAHKDCLWEFRVASGMDARESVQELPEQLQNALNGRYWQ